MIHILLKNIKAEEEIIQKTDLKRKKEGKIFKNCMTMKIFTHLRLYVISF